MNRVKAKVRDAAVAVVVWALASTVVVAWPLICRAYPHVFRAYLRLCAYVQAKEAELARAAEGCA